ncbi:MAG: helix-turn-helix transcriptional regulator [Rhizobiaceae bacterium]
MGTYKSQMTFIDDRIVHKIYGCATGEAEWEDALRPIMGLLDAKCLGIVKHSIAPTGAEVLVRIDVDQRTEAQYVDEYVHKNPVMNCLSAMPLGYVTCGSGAVDETYFHASSFYNDWQKPAGYADNLGMALARRRGEFVLLSMPRDFNRGIYTPEELSIIKPYVAHLVRAFNIWMRLQAAEAGQEWVSEALDQVGKGLIILGEDRVILYANKSGEKTLLSGQLAREDFRLVCKVRNAVQDMDRILHEFETGRDDETHEYGFAIPRGPGRPPLYVRVQPPLGLKPGQRSFGLPKAVAFLHIVDPEEREAIDTQLFCDGYALTSAEARLLDASVRTESVIEAALMLDISEATARTHMKHIYAKTGAKSFASLIGQVHRSTSRA